MMGGSILARATSDSDDRLVTADELLARLQVLCGGEMPGTIAVPALLETVRKVRRYELKLARSITAVGGDENITAWMEVSPREDGELGCDITVQQWQSTPLVPLDIPAEADLQAAIDRDLAELSARLDAQQCVLAVETSAADLEPLAQEMRAALGKPWTDHVSVSGVQLASLQPWQKLDGVNLEVAGSRRLWRARLIPHSVPGEAPTGFELCLNSDEALAPAPVVVPKEANSSPGLVGKEIAPVLRQPIARIIANAETIRTRLAGPLADEYSNYAADIAAAGQHLLALLDDLADLEVVESADFSTASDHIDLADVARQAAGILGVKAREKAVAIDAPKPGETLPAVAEFRRVLQVLLNLVGNAIRYSPANSQIWIRLEDGPGRSTIIVADQGPGLDADQQARVFDKFERLGRSGDGGSGLGLYISRRLARAMGGELSVESAPGRGARFILQLPA